MIPALRGRRRCLIVVVAAVVASGLLGGCGTTLAPAPQMLSIPAVQYGPAFDAALESARGEGLSPVLRDRRSGIIETEPEIAGSLLEPGRADNASFDQALENTVSLQRRRARFEFVPAGYHPPEEAELLGMTAPRLLLESRPLLDLTTGDTDLELRVWVFVERAYRPGVRRSTWSRRVSSKAVVYLPGSETKTWPNEFWTPVSRDPLTEQRLLEGVARRMGESGG